MAEAIFTLDGIKKSFGGVRALVGGALELYPGEVTALVGENGAGKSTLVKIMTGIHQPDSGRIRVAGKPVRIASQSAARKLGITAIHQESVIFDDLSVTENIFIADPLRRGGVLDWTKMRERAAALLASIDVVLDLDAPAGRLSVAQKHLVQIARSLAQQARVVIMDEPTAALSHREVADLFAIIGRLKKEGRAILFISHKFDEIFEISDRYAVFRDGAAVGSGRIADTDRDAMIAMMVGRPLAQVYPKKSVEIGAQALSVEGLSLGAAFEDVSFSVAKGEILGVYGLVGSGRSEVMQTVFGLNQPDAGQIRIGGRRMRIRNPRAAIRAGLAYVPEDRQSQGAVLPLSVRDNIALASWSNWSRFGLVDRAKRDANAARLAAQMQIKTDGLASPVEALSGGNQQKVVLAKWLATGPRVLILDEPTKGIDIGSKIAVHTVIGELVEQGIAVILVSSELPEVLGLADRVLVMRRGRVQGLFARADATPETVLRAATDA
jgi:rhamnose transport system ATP-binding protein